MQGIYQNIVINIIFIKLVYENLNFFFLYAFFYLIQKLYFKNLVTHLLILKPSFADYDILNGSSTTKFLFMHCVRLVDFLTLIFG